MQQNFPGRINGRIYTQQIWKEEEREVDLNIRMEIKLLLTTDRNQCYWKILV